MEINEIWNRIRAHEGETFYTASGLPMTYEFLSDDKFVPIRDGKRMWTVSRSLLEKAMTLIGDKKTFYHKITAPSYIYAILTDSRIAG